MNITLKGVESSNVLDKERLVFHVLEDTDLGEFAVLRCDRAVEDGRPLSGSFDKGYWFNLYRVRKGDLVILYSKNGKTRKKDIGNEKTSHFLYWGSEKPLWAADKIPVLLESPEWEFIEEDDATREPQEEEERNSD